jgi:hypothetical protein
MSLGLQSKPISCLKLQIGTSSRPISALSVYLRTGERRPCELICHPANQGIYIIYLALPTFFRHHVTHKRVPTR